MSHEQDKNMVISNLHSVTSDRSVPDTTGHDTVFCIG